MPTYEPSGILCPGFDITVATPPLALAASGTKTIFNIYGGPIHVKMIWGVVTTAIQNQACTLKLTAQIGALTAVDLCGTGAAANLGVGTILVPITSFATALSVANTLGVFINMDGASGSPTQFVLGMASGSAATAKIYMTTSATNTGAIQWYIKYAPYGNSTPVVGSQANYPVSQVISVAH